MIQFLDPRLPSRFWDKVQPCPMSGCWLWTASTNKGYGQIRWPRPPKDDGMRPAYRIAYLVLVGPIPAGLELDHLCRNTLCVNPTHMDPVTHRENILRGEAPAARFATRTHCINGHEYTPENTYITEHHYGVSRSCWTCRRNHDKARNRSKDGTRHEQV